MVSILLGTSFQLLHRDVMKDETSSVFLDIDLIQEEDPDIFLGFLISETETLLIKSHAVNEFLTRQGYSVFLMNLKTSWITTTTHSESSSFSENDLSNSLKESKELKAMMLA